MEIIQSVRELQGFRESSPHSSAPLVLVPTMGALHDGHAQLIRQARTIAGDNGSVIVSIFVNPIQFDRPEDLASYPVQRNEDHAICKALDVDAVFSPLDFYEADHSVKVVESSLSDTLCGATRPGHFDGVCTVVMKLFNATQASHAVFGKKDYQQLAIIRRMVRDLNLPVEIHGVDTVREPNGLALSSRNLRLVNEHRQAASVIRETLLKARILAQTELPATVLADAAQSLIASPANPRIDYLEIVDAETLQPVSHFSHPSVLATAVFFGDVRLIDNIEIPPHSS